jgi:hypothetical protein
MLIVKLAILRKVSLPSKDGYFYSTCYTFVVVNFPRNALVSFARNGWSACAGMWWSRSSESPGIALNVLGGEIIIDIKYQDAILFLSVKNTGTLKKKNQLEESLGIGLNNIRERLRLLYNDKAGLEIRENPPYLEVIITIDKS